MGHGYRDSFAANIDNQLGSIYDSDFDDNFMVAPRTRKKNKKSRKMGRKASRRKARRSSKRHQKHRSSGGIKYTKNGQPYKILANGRARFIKGRRK